MPAKGRSQSRSGRRRRDHQTRTQTCHPRTEQQDNLCRWL